MQFTNGGLAALIPRMTVGVMGSAGGAMDSSVCERMRRLGAAFEDSGLVALLQVGEKLLVLDCQVRVRRNDSLLLGHDDYLQ